MLLILGWSPIRKEGASFSYKMGNCYTICHGVFSKFGVSPIFSEI